MTNIVEFPAYPPQDNLNADVAIRLAAYRENDNWSDALTDPIVQVRVYAYSILNCWDIAISDVDPVVRSMAYDELDAYEIGLRDPDASVRISCLQMLSLQKTLA